MASHRLYQLDHCTYLCQYHLVWIPRYRGRVLADRYIKLELKRIFKLICRWKGLTPMAWHVGDEHVHLFLSIPPKHSVAYVVGILKGKSSAWIKKKTKKISPGPLSRSWVFRLDDRDQRDGDSKVHRTPPSPSSRIPTPSHVIASLRRGKTDTASVSWR